jgi:hypothetical protein
VVVRRMVSRGKLAELIARMPCAPKNRISPPKTRGSTPSLTLYPLTTRSSGP